MPTAASCNLLHQPTPFLRSSYPRCIWCDVKRAEEVDSDFKRLKLSRLSEWQCVHAWPMVSVHAAQPSPFMHLQAEGA